MIYTVTTVLCSGLCPQSSAPVPTVSVCSLWGGQMVVWSAYFVLVRRVVRRAAEDEDFSALSTAPKFGFAP
jgi:hypothetical protein